MMAPRRNPRVVSEQPWMGHAACRGMDPELWFPKKGQSSDRAKRVCAACVVRDACLQFAVSEGIKPGTWGGMTETERRPYRVAHLRRVRMGEAS